MASKKSLSLKSSLLEDLPIELLIRVICAADNEDLDQLFCVSKKVCAAAREAKRCHFDNLTPQRSKRQVKTPNAPRQAERYREFGKIPMEAFEVMH